MTARRRLGLLLLGWALLYGRGEDWETLDEFSSQVTCLRVRAAHVDDDVRDEMGSALADQPADNPLRQQAYQRAEQRVGDRYRCAPE